MGDEFDVKYFGIDSRTRKEKVSRKALLPRLSREEGSNRPQGNRKPRENRDRDHNRNRGDRKPRENRGSSASTSNEGGE